MIRIKIVPNLNQYSIFRKMNVDYYNETPIFQKTFNPTITSILNKETGEFFIENHFFSNNEEISYDPGSSFIGVIKLLDFLSLNFLIFGPLSSKLF